MLSAPAQLLARKGFRSGLGEGGFFDLRVSISVLVCAVAACSIVSGALLGFFRTEALAQRTTGKGNTPADVITVTNTNDSGPGSLRQALADAQDGDTINFDPSVSVVTLTTAELAISPPGRALKVHCHVERSETSLITRCVVA